MENKSEKKEDQNKGSYIRYFILGLVSFIESVTYLDRLLPIILEDSLISNETAIKETNFTMSIVEYNVMFSMWDYGHFAAAIPSGIFISKYGVATSSATFSTMFICGSLLFSIALYLSTRGGKLAALMLGRFIAGSATGSFFVLGAEILAEYFLDNLGFAVGAKFMIAKLSPIAVFYFLPSLLITSGMKVTLWLCWGVTALAFISGLTIKLIIASPAVKQPSALATALTTKNVVKYFLSDSLFWLFLLSMMFYHASRDPFFANASHIIGSKYDLSSSMASYATGTAYASEAAAYLFVGLLIARCGTEGVAMCSGIIAILTSYCIIAFTHANPFALLTMNGILHTFVKVGFWSGLTHIVPRGYVAIASGVATALILLIVAISTVVVGFLLRGVNSRHGISDHDITEMFIYLICNVSLAFLLVVAANIIDYRSCRNLNKRTKSEYSTM